MSTWSRRSLLKSAALMIPVAALRVGLPGSAWAAGQPEGPVPDRFPSLPVELTREIVLVSHFSLPRVKELVEARPALARAAHDWGFGDYESALGAASHMGNRPIAEYLIGKGARPSLFSAAMLGQLEVVKALLAAHPGGQRIRGPHSISLLAHAQAGGAAARPVYDFLQALGDAGDDPPVSLPEDERAKLLGSYVFGMGPGDQIEVTVEKMPTPGNLKQLQEAVTWTRKGTFGRPLFYLGDRTFYPAGAAAVRIRFAEDAKGMTMTVSDPDVVLTARRKSAS